MVAQLERAITIAEALRRGIKLVQALRKDGNGEAALILEKECNKLAKKIKSRSRRNSQSSRDARGRGRTVNGRFM